MSIPSPMAGGRATQAGMSFQTGVSAWFAAHLLSKAAIGTRFGHNRSAFAVRLQFETGRNLDDIEVQLSDGSQLSIQCKTEVTLSTGETSALASVIGQLVRLFRTISAAEQASAVLAVASSASGSLDDLNQVCRMFDAGATWAEVQGRANQDERTALDVFRNHALRSWGTPSNISITDEELAGLARSFRVARFDVEHGGADWREASKTLETGLYDDSIVSESAMVELQRIAQDLIRKGAPSDRAGWLRATRSAGLEDRRAPGFDADIIQLKKWTESELVRLRRHAHLANGVRIERKCLPALKDAVANGSLLVVGEPGAGKTGVLVHYARELFDAGTPLVFLSVDDLAATTDANALKRALGVENNLLDILDEWPGTQPGVLVIDALDASRGGASEAVFARTIEGVIANLGGRWSVVASIRTFDLRHGKRLRLLMQGNPPQTEYSEEGLESVRHFSIPRLIDSELEAIGQANGSLMRLLTAAPSAIRELLQNVFNLSLAAELVSKGLTPEAIQGVTSQSQLITRYENERLDNHRLRRVVTEVVTEMARQERLVVRQDQIQNDGLDDVIATGVLVQAPQDRVSFAHHVLFDHAVGRFYLSLDDASSLMRQVAGQPAIGLLLGPGLRFAIMDIWETGPSGRVSAWKLAADLASHVDMDPVLGSIALRTVIDNVRVPNDVRPFIELLNEQRRWPQTGHVLSRVSRFVRVNLPAQTEIRPSTLLAWAEVARAAATTGASEHADGARILLLTLMDKSDFEDKEFINTFGEAARSLLSIVWSNDSLNIFSSSAIRFVCRAFESNPTASRGLLERVITDPHFSEHASEEAPWLAEGVRYMVASAPDFVEKIYATLFGRQSPQEGDSWLGGPSRILPLRSNRKQDYEHARWHLEQVLPNFLTASPKHSTHAVSSCAIGLATEEEPDRTEGLTHVSIPGRVGTLSIVDDRFSLQEWRESEEHEETERRILRAFTTFLQSCPPGDFRQCTQAALTDLVASSVLARLFGIGADRRDVADDLLWPVATCMEVLNTWGLSRDAFTYIAAAMPYRSTEQRTAFEAMLVEKIRNPIKEEREVWEYRLKRLLSLIEPGGLISADLVNYQTQFKEQGELIGNPPYLSISSGWVGQDENIVDLLLRNQGVDTLVGPDAMVMSPVRLLEKYLKETDKELDQSGIATLWSHIQLVVSAIDDPGSDLVKEETLHAAWGYVSNGSERIASSKIYTPGVGGHPNRDHLLELLDRLSRSPFPKASSNRSKTMSWGNWDVRVYAALGYMSLARQDWDPSFEARLRRVLIDPTPTVRHQVSSALNTLWEVARPTMWELMEFVAEHETNSEVLAFFVVGPIGRLVGADADRCASMVSKILESTQREAIETENSRNELAEAIASIAAHLWLGKGNSTAKSWIDGWTANLTDSKHYVERLISELRGPLFLKWDEKVEAARGAAIQDRSRDLLSTIVNAELALVDEAKALLTRGEREAGETIYRRSGQQLQHAANQLYFGSGASAAGRGEASGNLRGREQKRAFLVEYGALLQKIGDTGISSIVYHLIELYEYLADASPEEVFDQIASLLLGPAAADGYQFESLAETALVRLVQTYLADYRSVFTDGLRRAQLVKVLELFSSAGAPEALRLLYELPDLLR